MHIVRLVRYELRVLGRMLGTWEDYDMPGWRSTLRWLFGRHRGARP
jgi:hypothetical protein